MEEALRALIVGDDDVTTIVPSASIRWGERLGNPAVVLYLITGPKSDQTMEGPSGLLESTVQVNCIGTSPAEAARIQQAVRRRVDGHTGSVLHLVTAEGGGSENDTSEGPVDGAKPAKFYTRRLDLRVRHYDP
jgi:hypothetical protein